MKKITLLLCLLLFCAVAPVFALFCYKCGKEMPDAANFCPKCGTASTGSFEPAPPAPASGNTPVAPSAPVTISAPVVISTPVVVVPQTAAPIQISLADYDSVNQMELLLSNSNYDVASREARKLEQQHNARMAVAASQYHGYGAYQRRLHDLHVKKFDALKYYLVGWKTSEKGPDMARGQAEKDKALFMLAQINEAIDVLLSGGGSLTSIAESEEIERRMSRTTLNYVITAPYILLDNQRLNRGEPIWVIDVVSGSAKVLHMGHGRSSLPICGWVSVYDLERRSNWRSDPVFFYSSAPPLPATPTVIYKTESRPKIIIIGGKTRYPYRHGPFPSRYPYDNRDKHDSRDKHDKHDDKRDKHDDKRDPRDDKRGPSKHRSYVVVEPKFW
ncbi:MAG: zinc ribbon domain-containing protein [Candidatus Riflebacteria bacterium]|nr:zinc ribbon domain-containing protein [Candidatus Riflebacteria bacterium]